MRIPLRTRRKAAPSTPESAISAVMQKVYSIYPARMMPSAIIRLLNEAGFVIISETDLDAEIALAFQAGQESGRDW
jgi:hypothetical protein